MIIFKIGIFYDSSFENVDDFVTYSCEQTNVFLYKRKSYQLEFFISKIESRESLKLKNLRINSFQSNIELKMRETKIFFNLSLPAN